MIRFIKVKLFACLLFFFFVLACNVVPKAVPTNNQGRYKVKSLHQYVHKDSVLFLINTYDLKTRESIEDATIFLFEDRKIQKLYQEGKDRFSNKPPFFTIKAFGYRPIETQQILIKKQHAFEIDVYLEPNENPIID